MYDIPDAWCGLTSRTGPRRSLCRRPPDVNRECGTANVIGVGSNDWLGMITPFHDFTLGLQPVVQFMARFGAAREVNFMGEGFNFFEAGNVLQGAVRHWVL